MMRENRNIPPPLWTLLLIVLIAFPALTGYAQRLSTREFEEIALELSEPAGSFDTDNLVSNESSYLHVLPQVRQIVKTGRAYLGVGPDQNFTYIAHVRPTIAFILDIRRENLLLHLYLKELFRAADDRWEYLSFLFGKNIPEGFRRHASASARDLAVEFQRFNSDPAYFEKNFERFWFSIRKNFPRSVQEEDRSNFYRIASAFFAEHLELKYHSHGRLPRPYYPSYQQLMTETDLQGRMGHYLNSERDFRLIKKMQAENRIIPVIGDFGGDKALQGVGQYLRKHDYTVSAFYLSNVEFYLFRNGTFSGFMENLKQLPADENSVLIRSYFSYWREHPETVPGYYVTSLVQRVHRFLELAERSPYFDYWDMVTRDYVPVMTMSLPN